MDATEAPKNQRKEFLRSKTCAQCAHNSGLECDIFNTPTDEGIPCPYFSETELPEIPLDTYQSQENKIFLITCISIAAIAITMIATFIKELLK